MASELVRLGEAQLAKRTETNVAMGYLLSLNSQVGRQAMLYRLLAAAEILTGERSLEAVAWTELTPDNLIRVKATLELEGRRPATVNLTLAALRGVARQAWRSGRITLEDYTRLKDIQGVRGSSDVPGRMLTKGELSQLMAACGGETGAKGARDSALVAVAYCCGLRRAELCSLALADWDAEAQALRVTGKGGKERLVYAANGALEALEEWLAVRGEEPGVLFPAINKGGRIDLTRHLTGTAVWKILKRLGGEAGVATRFTPHDFRRTFISDLLDTGTDVSTVQRLAGHASPATTTRYDRRPEEAKRRATALLYIPFTKRRVVDSPPRGL